MHRIVIGLLLGVAATPGLAQPWQGQGDPDRLEGRRERAAERQPPAEPPRDRPGVGQALGHRAELRGDRGELRGDRHGEARRDRTEFGRDATEAGRGRTALDRARAERAPDRFAVAGASSGPASGGAGERGRDARQDARDWRDDQRDRRDWRDDRGPPGGRTRDDRRPQPGGWERGDRWSQDWRRDARYDWQSWRQRNRDLYRAPRYFAPRGYADSYRRWAPGYRLQPWFYASSYWIGDPWRYRLPSAYGPYRWVRYYDDVVLIDLRSGLIVDVIYAFFW